MLDNQRIVEEIQAALAATAVIDWDLLRDCAAEYAEACDEVNARLSQCGQLLRQGLRSEAIQLAERSPNLLDAVAQLDFPELEQWQQLLTVNGMVLPPQLRVDVASDLNTAYAVEAPLQYLLKRHRLLALARAPLVGRIQVLRAIRQADPGNPLWGEDLQTLELHRLQEVASETEAALAIDDAAALCALVQETTDPAWTVRPREELVGRVRFAYDQAVAEHAQRELTAVEQQLAQAYQDYDIEAARRARQQWDTLLRLSMLDRHDPIVAKAQVALDWLAQQETAEERKQAHAAAVHALERALDDDAPRAKLERLMLAIQRFDEETPSALLMRYRERLRVLETSARRQFVLKIAAVVGVLVILGGVTTWALRRHQREQQLATAAHSFNQLVNGKKLEEAQRFLEEIRRAQPESLSRAEIQEPATRLAVLIENEQKRADRFDRLMDVIEAEGIADFSRGDFIQARQLVLTTDEKNRAADWESQVSKYEKNLRIEHESTFRTEIAALLQSVQELETKLFTPDGDARLAAAQTKVKALNSKWHLVSPELREQVQPITARLGALATRQMSRRRQQAHFKRVTEAVGDPERFRRELEEFGKLFPESSLAEEFRQTASESPWWVGVEAWREFYESDRLAELGRLTPDDAKRALEMAKPLLEKHGDSPQAELWRERLPHVEAVAARVDGNGRSRAPELRRVFDDPLLNTIHCITSQKGKRYYLNEAVPAERLRKAPTINFKYLMGFDFSEKSVALDVAEIASSGPAPQQELSKTIRASLDEVEQGKWDSGFFAIILSLLDETHDIDPVLRLVLLKRTLDVAQQGSHSLRVASEELRKRLEENRSLLAANWLDPDDEKVEAAREASVVLLAKSADADALRTKAKEVFRADTAPFPAQPQWIGWLMREGEELQLLAPNRRPSSGALVNLHADSVGKMQWIQLGEAGPDGVTWSSKTEGIAAGRPVFLMDDKDAATAVVGTR